MPKNYMEDVVDNLLPSVLKSYPNICTCNSCLMDIKALALNNLKPIYIVSSQGHSYAKINELDPQFKINVIQKIVQAIEIVSNNMRHQI